MCARRCCATTSSVAFEVARGAAPRLAGRRAGRVRRRGARRRARRTLAEAAIAAAGPVDGVGICNQRASTVVWDRATGEPVGPALGWQDLRTIGACLALRGDGLRARAEPVGDEAAVARRAVRRRRSARDLCFGTVDTWIAWTLSGGEVFVTDPGNAGVTGLAARDVTAWDESVIDDARSRAASRCRRSSTPPGPCGSGDRAAGRAAVRRDRRRPTGVARGPGVRAGRATPRSRSAPAGCSTSTSAIAAPEFERRSPSGTFPIVAWRVGGHTTWGAEAVMLAAGTNIQWLRDDLGLVASAEETHTVAAACADSGGVWFVPAPLGLGTPQWDYGARSALFGLTRGSGRAEVVRAVLEGIAHRGADLVDATERDTGVVDRGAAHRRRHERQPDLRAGARRRDRTPGRDLAGARRDDARRRPARPRRARRASRAIDALADTWKPRTAGRAAAACSIAIAGARPAPAPATGSRSCRASTSSTKMPPLPPT